jgi:hypothetical protein
VRSGVAQRGARDDQDGDGQDEEGDQSVHAIILEKRELINYSGFVKPHGFIIAKNNTGKFPC